MIRRAVAAFLLVAVAGSGAPSLADTAERAAYERAFFRTITLLYPTAPRETVAAATQCVLGAAKGLPDTFRRRVVEVDRRPVYRGTDRLIEISASLAGLDKGTVAPLSACFDRLGAGGFGATEGAVPATAAAHPDGVAPCPVSVSGESGGTLTCYCRPMLGGIAYGHRTYSDASSICLAARHAGAADFLTGGVVRAVFKPGCAAYESVEANGALSAAAGRSARSFHFPAVGAGRCPD